jgi:hypothetical protein
MKTKTTPKTPAKAVVGASKRGPSKRVERPVDNSKLIGSMKGKIKILGDIFSTGEKWDANS